MYTNLEDPLAMYERKQKHRTFFESFQRTCSFLVSYLLLSGSIFGVLVVGVNYSAYSKVILNWVNPDALMQARDEFNNILTSATSVSVYASDTTEESRDDLESITHKILESDPSAIYSRKYAPKELIANVDTNATTDVSFTLTPYENRIIIPRINKNIPLVDVSVSSGASFETMHEVFMEELRKGVVRYPGTAVPGETGNVFIFGHSSNYPWVKSDYNDVFALLGELQNGDEIIIYYFQKKYVYKVTDHAVVKPGDVKTLESRDPNKKELSIMTCWPIGTTLERIIFFATLDESAK